VAGRCRKAGWSVAVIDELPFGGTGALRGCGPWSRRDSLLNTKIDPG